MRELEWLSAFVAFAAHGSFAAAAKALHVQVKKPSDGPDPARAPRQATR